MEGSSDHTNVWALIRRQHGVISRAQLIVHEYSRKAIEHRLDAGRLRLLWPGVYGVGQLETGREGWWMAAVLAAGSDAILSHESAAALWGIYPTGRRLAKAGIQPIHVSVPADRRIRLSNIQAHRRKQMRPATTRGPIPLSQPLFTLLDLAPALGDRALESALNEADKLNLIHPKQAGKSLEGIRAPGIARLRRIVAGHKRTDSDLERDFLRLVRNAGLPEPETQRRINGHRVDFYWPQHNLVVETDGSAYHRTPSQQIRDRKRDQDPDYVVETLRAVQQLQ